MDVRAHDGNVSAVVLVVVVAQVEVVVAQVSPVVIEVEQAAE